jgi:predicted O-methyltransferase YrrM
MSKKIDFRNMKEASADYILLKFAQNEIKNFLRYCFNKIRGKSFKRDTELVYSIYETRRLDQLKNYTFTTLDEYIFGSPTSNSEKSRWNLFEHKLVFSVGRKISDKKYSLIEEKINSLNLEYIVELGSGGGRNILHLARKFPQKKFVGIELSPSSVELSKRAAKTFKINNVEFYARDLTQKHTYEELIKSSSLVFSMHCLEEMPRIFKIPLNLLKEKKVENIFFLEPAFIFQPKRHILELSRLLRIVYRDRLWGLTSFCKKNFSKNYDISILDLGIGNNPVNPTSMIYMKIRDVKKN